MNLLPVAVTSLVDGNDIYTFTASGTFTVTSINGGKSIASDVTFFGF